MGDPVEATPQRAHRLETDGLNPADVADQVLALSGWRHQAATALIPD